MSTLRKPYPTDVTDDEWAFVAPYLTLLAEDASQRRHDLREVFNAVRWIVRAGAPWRLLPTDFPPWEAVYQQAQRWIAAGSFEAIVHDLRLLLRAIKGRQPRLSATIWDGRTLQSSPESGGRAGYDGYKRRKGSKVHQAVDTLGYLLAVHVTPASEQIAQVDQLAQAVQAVTGEQVELAYVDQGYSGDAPEHAAATHGIRPRHAPGRGQTLRGQARLRLVAPPLGGRAQLRLDGTLSPPRPRLRAVAENAGRVALSRLRWPHAASAVPLLLKFITRSKKRSARSSRL